MSRKGLNVKKTWGGIDKLNVLIKREKDARVKERLQAILWRLENITYTEIAKRLKRTIDTVREWIKNWNRTGYEGLIDKPKSGRPTILTSEETKEMADELNIKEKNSRITCKHIVNKISEKYQKTMSDEGVRTMLHRNNLSWKKPEKVDYRRNEKQRSNFLNEFSKKNIQSV
jgi:transposase